MRLTSTYRCCFHLVQHVVTERHCVFDILPLCSTKAAPNLWKVKIYVGLLNRQHTGMFLAQFGCRPFFFYIILLSGEISSGGNGAS